MTINIDTAPIVLEVRQKSHLNVQDIPDAQARYNGRAGLEKMPEITNCILDAFAQLTRRCTRFLDEVITAEGDDSRVLPQTYTYVFAFAERRAINKLEPMTGVMHDFVVAYALSKWYSTTNKTDLSNQYSLQAIDYGNQLDELLYHKQAPRV